MPPSTSSIIITNTLQANILVYLLGLLFTSNFVLIFIITILLLAADFYYLKNIAGRRLVGLRWWNEVDAQTGDSHWVFESAEPESRVINATDKRFFWLALYAQPVSWVALAVVAIVRFEFIWLTLVGKFDSTSLPPVRYDQCFEEHRYCWRRALYKLLGKGLIRLQSLQWFLQSQTRWLSRDAISLVRHQVWLRVLSTRAIWQGTLVVL